MSKRHFPGGRIESEGGAANSSLPKRESPRMGAIWLPGWPDRSRSGVDRSMFIHVKGWVVVRGSGWLKDSSGGRGCNKRNGYSGPARMPSLRDEQSDMFTQQRVASYNCENAYPRLSAIPLATVPAAPRFISFAVQRRCYFHYASRFISVR